MVMEMSPLARGRTAARIAAADTLRELPKRRPQAAAEPTAEVIWELVDVDRYEIREAAVVLGYVDVVGAVFVALSGPWYASAVEVRQTLRFEEAVDVLRSAHRR
ncbi:hypothetical protein [Microbacterium radiodurans]|nr:hypothetical protein [Microbacterium radiodurans]